MPGTHPIRTTARFGTLAVAEISTNQKVQGGGAYSIISRSFGINRGTREIIGEGSPDADLSIVGFRQEQPAPERYKQFDGFNKLGNVLFVSANKTREIN